MPMDVTVPLIIKVPISEQRQASMIWMVPNKAEAVPLLWVKGFMASSVVAGKRMPIGKMKKNIIGRILKIPASIFVAPNNNRLAINMRIKAYDISRRVETRFCRRSVR